MSTVAIAVEEKRERALSDLTRSWLLADLATGRTNNFNLIRFFAASMVILSHSCALAYGNNPEPMLLYMGGLETAGGLGVMMFFAISGFLVAQSFVNRGGHLKEFFVARGLRLFPGLIAASIFCIALGSFATTLPLRKYFGHHETFLFLFQNAFGYPINFYLPGVFKDNPFPGGVNGSLWTLPLEMQMYLVCASLGFLGLYASREWFNAFFAAFIVLTASIKPEALPLIVGHPEAPRLAIIFLFGIFFFVNRRHIPISLPLAILMMAAMVYWHKTPNIKMVYLPAIAYMLLVLSYHPKLYFAPFNRLGDYSYGLYIYAFGIQQLIVHFNRGVTAYPLFLEAYPPTLLVAVLSWHFIEKPALGWKPIPARVSTAGSAGLRT